MLGRTLAGQESVRPERLHDEILVTWPGQSSMDGR